MKEKIYYFQEKSNDILDLQDDFTVEEIGIYFILKAAYFKYAGELKEENLCQRCKFFGHKENLNYVKNKIFELKEGLLVNKVWLSEINDIKQRSEKRRLAAFEKWEKERRKKEAKEKQIKSKKETNINDVYKELAGGLLFVLEAKLQRRLKCKDWEEEIRKLIEIDLSVRQNPIQDVKNAIQTIADNYGKNYFPVVQSAISLREKFTKIEDYIKRNNSQHTRDQQQDLINKQLEEMYANNQDF